MNFGVTQRADGTAELTWEKPTDIRVLLFNSLNIRRGIMINLPNFGLDLSDIKKVTDENVTLIEERIRNAVQWIQDTGKAKSIDVIVEKDNTDFTRINYRVDAVQADGVPVFIEDFVTVGGPADGFTIS